MTTYQQAKYIDPIIILTKLNVTSYYNDDKFLYYCIKRDVVELGYRYKKTVEFRLSKTVTESSHYYFYLDDAILYLAEVVALILSESLSVPTTNQSILNALAFINSNKE